jgi:cell division protein FtsA
MTRQQLIAGIDIGSSKITTLIASVSPEDERPKIIGVASVASKGIRKGQVVNIEEATGAIVESVEAAERMAGYGLEHALVSVGGPLLSSQNSKGVVAIAEPEGEISSTDVQRVVEAAKAISLPSSREIIHVVPRDFTVDGQEGIKDPIGMSGIRLEVETHIVTGPSTALRNLNRCVTEVGADIQDMVAGSLASAESVLTDTEKELGVILVDIGGGTTDIAIYVDGSPFYLSVLPVGAKNVTNDMAIGMRVSLESAEKIKLGIGKQITRPVPGEDGSLGLDSAKPKTRSRTEDDFDLTKFGISEDLKSISRKTLVEGIIRPRLNEIFTLVGNEIQKSGAHGLTPSGIVLTGGGALTVGAMDSAKRMLSMPVRIGTPNNITGLIDDIQTPEYATAVGLIFYGSTNKAETGSGSSLNQIGKKFSKLPVRGVADKLINLVKSFLP